MASKTDPLQSYLSRQLHKIDVAMLIIFRLVLSVALLTQCLVSAIPVDSVNLPNSANQHSTFPIQKRPADDNGPHRFIAEESSAGKPLDPESQQILDSLLKDLSDTNNAQEGAHTETADTSSKKRAKISYAATLSHKASRQWWEPDSFSSLKMVPTLSTGPRGAGLTLSDDAQIRDQISNSIFAGKLKWVPKADLAHVTQQNYRNIWPYRRTSRALPLLYDKYGATFRIHMTEHGNLPQYSRTEEGSALHNRPFWFFWSLKQTDFGRKHVINHGAGYTDPSDHKDIDEHLRTLLSIKDRPSWPHK